MEFLNTNNLVGQFVPNPYISKVTLKTSGNPPRVVNPHIVDPRETSSQDQQSTENLRVTVNINIKDILKNNQPTWLKPFAKNGQTFNIEQLLKVYVVQFRNQNDVTNFIPNRTYLTDNFEKKDYKESLLSELKGDINSPNTYVEVTDSYERIYNTPYNPTFEVKDKDPSFLAYYCWVEIDLEQLQAQFDFQGYSPQISDNLTKSRIEYISVIKNSQLVTKAFYFADDDGKIWTGPVHQMPNGQWMTGESHSDSGTQLNKIQATNSKVQDFRNVERLEKINLDFTILENSLKADPMFSSKARTANISLDKETKAFSSMFLTRDRQNDVRYMFAVDVGRVLQSNSEFPQLLNNDMTRDRVISGSTINNIQLRRVRLAGSPEAGADPLYVSDDLVRSPIKFDHGSSTFLLSGTTNTTDQDEVVFNESPSSNILTAESVKQFNGNQIYSKDIPSNNQSIFYYSGIDAGARLKTDGFYQYKVIMSIKDGSVEYLESQMRSLIDTKKDIEDYLEEASKLGTPGFRNPFSDPHIDPPWEIEGYAGGRSTLEPRDEKPGNFNPSANRFTENFIQNQESLSDPENYIWNVASNVYGNIYANLSGQSQSSLEVETIKDSLENYMNPRTGNPNGIRTVIKLYDQMIDKLKQQIGIVRDPRVSRFTANQIGKTSIQTQGASRDKIIKVEFTFPEIYRANNLTTEGTDVLGMPQITDSRLRVISGEQFTDLITAETKKIFTSTTSQLALGGAYSQQGDAFLLNSINITDYSYLTPTMLLSKGKEVNTTSSNNPIDYEEIMNGAQAGRSNSLLSFLSSEHNISLVSENEPTLPFRQPFKGPVLGEASVNVEENYRKRANESSLNAGLADARLSELARNLNPLNSSDIIASASSIDMYDPSNSNGFTAPQNISEQEVSMLPNQIKAIMSFEVSGANDPAGKQSINDNAFKLLDNDAPTNFQYQPEYKYKFQTIYRIEAFNGWQKQSDTSGSSATMNAIAMADSWITMDRDVYNAARIQNKILFCRIRRYENQPLGIVMESTKEPPLFEEYFFINPQGTELPAPFFITPEELIRTSRNLNPYVRTDVTVAVSPAEATIRARAQVQQNQSSQGPQPGQPGGAITQQTTSSVADPSTRRRRRYRN